MKCKWENSKFLINFRLDKINFMTNLKCQKYDLLHDQPTGRQSSLDNQNVINDANKYYNQILHKRNNDFTAVTIYCLNRKSSFKRKLNCNTTWLGIRQKFRKKIFCSLCVVVEKNWNLSLSYAPFCIKIQAMHYLPRALSIFFTQYCKKYNLQNSGLSMELPARIYFTVFLTFCKSM